MKTPAHLPDVIVLSHLRWDFVYQRPQHLLSRCARQRRVWFIEEPLFEPGIQPTLDVSARGERLFVAVPRLPAGVDGEKRTAMLRALVDDLVSERVDRRFVAWYYTPMALAFTRHLRPAAVVYDCMDELSNFKGAPPDMGALEDELFQRADVIFTGGISLYEHKRAKHRDVHPFPSSVDCSHFRSARVIDCDPADETGISRPRIGYAGVLDERIDIELVRDVAQARPEWQFVMVGPVVKIDPASLPRGPNLHYLGAKAYGELPAYLASWDIAFMPFARNDATRFISPTKTPEYLAAGRPVVSTPIRDVVRTYGEAGLASIVDDAASCIAAIDAALARPRNDPHWLARVDAFLNTMSWDRTFEDMWRLVERCLAQRSAPALARAPRSIVPAHLPAATGIPSTVSPPAG